MNHPLVIIHNFIKFIKDDWIPLLVSIGTIGLTLYVIMIIIIPKMMEATFII